MSILFGMSLLTLSVAILAFVVDNTLIHFIGLVMTIILVYMAMCFESHTLGRIKRLEKELEKLKRSF